MTKTNYDDETKAMAVLLKCLRAIQRHMFLISLIFLKERFLHGVENGLANIKDTSLASQKKIDVGEFLMALLEQELITLEAIAQSNVRSCLVSKTKGR
jgi:hypothetical protein